jgi:hypothetical protein
LSDRIAVGQEQEVEQTALGHLCRLDGMVEVHDIVGPGILVTPATQMTAQTEQPGHQIHHGNASILVSDSTDAMQEMRH